MEVASSGVWRFPKAEAVKTDDEWLVELLEPAEGVLPLGVLRDEDFENKPTRLRSTTSAILDNLREAVTERNPNRSAHKLAQHVRQFFAPELCGDHGLPVWHTSRTQVCQARQTERAAALSVAHVRNLVNFLDALIDAVEQVNLRRAPCTPRQVIDLLEYLPLGALDATIRERLARDGRLELPSSRLLVRSALDESVKSSALVLSARWPAGRPPQLALVAWSPIALYVADQLLMFGHADAAQRCSVCGNLFNPRRTHQVGQALYCQRPECQRRRLASNQARYRERKAAQHG
jgi:hypothetical protein